MNPQTQPGIVPTEFVTEQQAEELGRILDLALEDADEVSGGLAPSCKCVNCCNCHRSAM